MPKESATAVMSPPIVPEKITVEKVVTAKPKPVNLKLYWVGVTKECPTTQATPGGISFPLWGEMGIQYDENGIGTPRVIRGNQINLTEDQVKRVKTAVANSVVRAKGAPRGVIDIRDNYVPMADDVPMARYCYMIPLGENISMTLARYMNGMSDIEPETMEKVEDGKSD